LAKLPTAIVTEGEKVAETAEKGGFGKKLFDKVLENIGNFNFGSSSGTISGLATKALGSIGSSYLDRAKNTDTGVLPALKTPTRVQKETNPTINTIIKQLDRMIKLANRIGVITKQQQEDLLNQIQYDRRIAETTSTETKTAEQIPSEGISVEALEPLNDAFSTLTNSILNLIDLISNQSNTPGGLTSGGLSKGKGVNAPAAGKSKPRSNFKDRLNASKKVKAPGFTRPSGRNMTPAERHGGKENIPKMRRPSITSDKPDLKPKFSDLDKLSLAGNGLAGLGLVGAIGDAALSSKGKAPGETPPNLDKITKQIAIPILNDAYPTSKLPEIVISNGSPDTAINKILSGDLKNSGVDLLTTNALTGLQPLIDTISHDVYPKIYNGLTPDSDPFINNRLPLIKDSIKSLVRSMLMSRIKKIPSDKPERVTKQTDNPKAAATQTAAGTPASTSASKGTSGTAASSSTPASKGTSGTAAPAGSQMSSPPAGTLQQPKASSGAAIAASTQEVNNMDSSSYSMNSYAPMMPAATATTRSGATGMGNVRDPNFYNIPASILETL